MSTQDPQAMFTEEQVGRQAGLNARGMSLGILALARNHGESPDSAARFLGEIFAPGWEALKGKGAFVALQRAALNAVFVGVPLHALSGDEHRAEAVFGEWPADADLDLFGLTRDDTAAIFAIFEPVARFLGLTCQWERRGREVLMVMESGGA